jgi:hypothetical protein
MGSAPAPGQSFGTAPGGDGEFGSAPTPNETMGSAPKSSASKNVPLLLGGGIAILVILGAILGFVVR